MDVLCRCFIHGAIASGYLYSISTTHFQYGPTSLGALAHHFAAFICACNCRRNFKSVDVKSAGCKDGWLSKVESFDAARGRRLASATFELGSTSQFDSRFYGMDNPPFDLR